MAIENINVLLSSFPGLSLPPTLSFAIPSTSTVADVTAKIESYLPETLKRAAPGLVLTTTGNKQLLPQSNTLISSYLPTQHVSNLVTTFLPLRLSVPLRGGKGGFGSQLRAAGGRMSSKRKGNQGENNGSNRNLDGRRLRTVNEAKALAEYLAVKPEMDKKEKEERRQRWEAIVEMAAKRTDEIKNGGGKSRLDGQWVEDKEEMSEKAREAVLAAMKDGAWKDNLRDVLMGGSSTSASEGNSSGEDSENESAEEESPVSDAQPKPAAVSRRYIGFDNDDEFMSRHRYLHTESALSSQTQPESTAPEHTTNPESSSPPLPPASVSLRTDVLPLCCPGCGAYSQSIKPTEPGYYSLNSKRTKKLWHKAQDAISKREQNSDGEAGVEQEQESAEVATQIDENTVELDPAAAIDAIQSSTTPAQICDRCHDLLHHNKGISAPSPTIDSIAAYLEESPHKSNRVYHIVDAADFPMSLVSNIYEALELQSPKSRNRRANTEKYRFGKKMATISFVITRADLLAATKEQVDSLMQRVRSIILKTMSLRQEDVRLGNVHMISAHRGWWTSQVKEEIRQHGGGIWVVGKANVGKSSFIESCFPKDSRNLAKITELFERRKEEELKGPSDHPALDSKSLLPPAPREELFPTLPVVSSLPGTTVSPIRIPFGRGRGEMIDLPGLDRGTLQDFILDEHKSDMIMTKRINPAEQMTISETQSLLIGGGLVRITPVVPEGCILLAACFVPLETHTTRTDKAIEVQRGMKKYNTGGGDRGTSVIKPEFLNDECIKSAGTFKLATDVTLNHLPSLIKKKWKDQGIKPNLDTLPYRVFSTDIVIEGCGWIELTAQVRAKQGLDSTTATEVPKVEIFTPLGKHVSARPSLETWNFIRDKRKADKRKGMFTSGSHRPQRQNISHKKRVMHGRKGA
ncbi:telomere stability and silencing-domain-containing protein [Talaromyces proteolyticus]|uniref:Telomere stability and silencing-domain-containing protein n=1 Tax=Talaromyces proteolyticus TaxID=1131652 RepID=A0AAD4L1U7_9EURO|nr:telomere stability and silencing-domain-containing protein [Talaromyces proteolyticus]KAH8701684.1 telomere stability and silencing-domain-containing protein [Talaromyces proteolyticus]